MNGATYHSNSGLVYASGTGVQFNSQQCQGRVEWNDDDDECRLERCHCSIITLGTLSPIDLYPKLLQFEPCISESFDMSTFRPCIRPLVITRGSDQFGVSTKFDDRGDVGVVRNYGENLYCGKKVIWNTIHSYANIQKSQDLYAC